MTAQRGGQCEDPSIETVEIPMTDTTQCALNGAIAHLYDELAAANTETEERTVPSKDVFEAMEDLYVATAEESVASVEITYERCE